MEQIYTIPVNEAFEKTMGSGECPFCVLEDQLEENEIELILGASMMEPDVRKKTNAMGFCRPHYKIMFSRAKKLPLALILESHLTEVSDMLPSPGLLPAASGKAASKKLKNVSECCYVCSRMEYNFSRMLDTAAYLWETDEEFRRKCKKQTGYCIPHTARFISAASSRMRSKQFGEFYTALYSLESKHIKGISENLSSFVKSFDYRYSNVPIDNAKDAVEKTIALISGKNPK